MALVSTIARLWAHIRGRRYGASMWTASGHKFWPIDPHVDDVRFVDVARGLAAACRYQGQIGIGTGYQFYSVAEHSVLVSYAVEQAARDRGHGPDVALRAAMSALLHDASEAYIADVARPLKYTREMKPYRTFERAVQATCFRAFDATPDAIASKLIAEMDNRVLVDEIRAFMNSDATEDEMIAKWGRPLECEIKGLAPKLAEYLFTHRYSELAEAISQL